MTMRGCYGMGKSKSATTVTAQTSQQSGRPPLLKSCLARQQGRKEDSRKAVSFNDTVQTVWCSSHAVVGHDDGLETTFVSEVHSQKWRAYLVRQKALRRECLRDNLKAGSLRSCAVYMMPRDAAMAAETMQDRDSCRVGRLLHPMFRYLTSKPTRPVGPTTTEVQVLHITNEQLRREAISIIDAMAINASNRLKPARRSLSAGFFLQGGSQSQIDRLAVRFKETLDDGFRAKGIMSPYWNGTQPKAVKDARQDGDWREVRSKAAALCKSCPSVSDVQDVENLLESFGTQLKNLIGA